MAIELRALEQLQTFTILAPQTVATNLDGTKVNLGDIDGDALFILNAAASGDAAETINVKIQHSLTENGTYNDVPGGAFTILGNAAVQQKISVPRDELRPWFKLLFTDRASYSAAVSCVAVGGARYAV
jgi:hypothetical protein